MPKNEAETMAGGCNCPPRLLTAARLCLNSQPELLQSWGPINLDHKEYHSNPVDIRSTVWIPHILVWWRQPQQTHSKYINLSNVTLDIFSMIPDGIGVEASFSLEREVIGWRQSKTTCETLCTKVVVRQGA
jgi:hypothetical protein